MTDLDTLDALHAAATPGRWGADKSEGRCYVFWNRSFATVHDPMNIGIGEANAAEIAALHNTYPALARELRAARALYELMENEILHWENHVCEYAEGDWRKDHAKYRVVQLRTAFDAYDAAIREEPTDG